MLSEKIKKYERKSFEREENITKKLVTTLILIGVFISALRGAGYTATPDWTPQGGFQYNMVRYGYGTDGYGTVYICGIKINKMGYLLGAFGPGGETDCRAVYNIGENGLEGFYYLTIGGDNDGEAISLKVYDSISDQVYDVYIEDEDESEGESEGENKIIFNRDSTETLNLHVYPAYYYSLAPVNLSANVVTTAQINLEWDDRSKNEYRFEIFRCINADPNRISHYNLIACVDPDVTWYSDPDCSLGNTYYYRVRAFNNQYGYTDYSACAGATIINKYDLRPSASSHQSGCFISSVQSGCSISSIGRTSPPLIRFHFMSFPL